MRVSRSGLQEVDFGRPGVALLGVEGSVAVPEEVAEDFVGGMGEEVGEGGGVPGAREAVGGWGFHSGSRAYQVQLPLQPMVTRDTERQIAIDQTSLAFWREAQE